MSIQEKTSGVEDGQTEVINRTYLETVSDILSKPAGVANDDTVTIDSDDCNTLMDLRRNARRFNNQPSFLRGTPVEFISLSDIKPKPIQWLIPGLIPKGMITVLASDGGVGKTSLSLWLASLVSNQGEIFNGKPVDHGRVLIWTGEDSAEYVLSPRLRALGADPDFVDIIGNQIQTSEGIKVFDITTDISEVERSLKNRSTKEEPYKLLIIDPVMSVVRGDSNQPNTVRQSLEPLRILAERQNVAVIGITHYSKGTSKSLPQDRVIGSQAFVALARMVLGLAKDEETGNRRLVVLKSNIVDTNIGYEFSYQFFTDVNGCDVARIDLVNELHGNARELLAEIEPAEEGTAVYDAMEFLKSLLSDGALPSKQIKVDADGAGYSWDTIKRASIKLKIEKRKDKGINGVWRWSLPSE